ncbi:hypothetical protein ACU4GD_18430 [Cupriavidus basilensis]
MPRSLRPTHAAPRRRPPCRWSSVKYDRRVGRGDRALGLRARARLSQGRRKASSMHIRPTQPMPKSARQGSVFISAHRRGPLTSPALLEGFGSKRWMAAQMGSNAAAPAPAPPRRRPRARTASSEVAPRRSRPRPEHQTSSKS